MPPRRQAATRASTNKVSPPDASIESSAIAPRLPEDVGSNDEPVSKGADQPNAQGKDDASHPEQATSTPSATTADNTTTVEGPTPPAKRLDSLGPPPSGSRGRGRGGRLLSQPKFSGRRSAAARLELEKAEAEKRRGEAETKAREEAGKAKRGGRGRDGLSGPGRGRGRGAHAGDNERKPGDGVASGPFSAGQASKDDATKKKSGSGGGGSYDSGGSGVFGDGYRQSEGKTNARNASGSGQIKQDPDRGTSRRRDADGDVLMDAKPFVRRTEHGGYISSDEEEEQEKGMKRVNVEDFSIIDMTRDDKLNMDAFAPVRVARVAHKERAVGINADGATDRDGHVAVDARDAASGLMSDKKQGKQKSRDVEIVGEAQPFMSVYEDSSSDAENATRIKPDPDAPEQSVGGPTELMQPHQSASSPERQRKAKDKHNARTAPNMAVRPDYQTREELEEWDRLQHDLETIKAELGTSTSSNREQNGDTTMSDDQTNHSDKRANKIYLFQFPPILPDLEPVRVKPDPESSTTNNPLDGNVGDAMQIDGPSNTASNPISISDTASGQPKLPSGHVGKLRIHASGRATLDWGGVSMAVGLGAEASFLQEVMLVKMPEGKDDVKEEEVGAADDPSQKGLAISLGPIERKFIVTPDWDEILK